VAAYSFHIAHSQVFNGCASAKKVMKTVDGRRANLTMFFKRFIYASGAVLVCLGLAMMFAAFGTDRLLEETEPLFGVKNSVLLLAGGGLQLGLGCYLLLPGDLVNRGMLALWAGCNCGVYYCAMIWMKTVTPIPVVQLVGWKIGFRNPRVLSLFWGLFVAFLIVGCVVLLVHERRRVKQLGAEIFMKRWAESRRRASELLTEPLQRGIRASKNRLDDVSEFKFSCQNCGQHIRCDEGYSGRQIRCPVCHREILVPFARGRS
jgi:DNA-directed RNA polymerase subunit RPC12/RpoP